MVIPNFFITFVRHSFHTSHSLHIPSRERRHRPAHTPATRRHTPLMAHALPHALRTRAASRITHTRLPHTLHLARAMPHALRTHYAPSPLQHTRPPRYPPPCKAMPHTLRILALTAHSPSALPPSQRAAPCRATTKHESHAPPRTHAPQVFCEESASPITTKILHITILHVTFTRIGVKTTQKSEAIFSFID